MNVHNKSDDKDYNKSCDNTQATKDYLRLQWIPNNNQAFDDYTDGNPVK